MAHDTAANFAKWEIFHGNDKWSISVYKGTPVADIKETISDVTGISKFVCLDQAGDILTLSSYLPSNIKIFIQPKQISQTQTQPKSNNHNNNNNNNNDEEDNKFDQIASEFIFDASTLVTSEFQSLNNHKLSDNNHTFEETKNKGWGAVMTKLKMIKNNDNDNNNNNNNIYAFSTHYSNQCCCYDKFYLIDINKLNKYKQELIQKGELFKWEHDVYSSNDILSIGHCVECDIRFQMENIGIQLTHNSNYELIHIIDFENNIYWIFYQGNYNPLICYKNIPDTGVIFAQGIKHKIKCKIKLLDPFTLLNSNSAKKYILEKSKQTKERVCQ